jgi:hypothetical protein
MLATVVYYIWKERNASLNGDAPYTSSMIYRDIVSWIVSKVNHIRNMASSITNRRLHIAWGFLMIFFILFDLFIGSLGFDDIFF